MRRVLSSVLLASVAALFGVACGSSSKSSANTVNVTLTEFHMTPSPAHFPPGKVDIEADNVGGEEHEMVIVRAAGLSSLPHKPDGSIDEDKIVEADKMGEIEDIASHAKKSKTFDLAAGTYVMFCNIVNDGPSGVSHTAKGMVTQFTVGS